MTDDIAREFEDAMQPVGFYREHESDDNACEPWRPDDEDGVDWCLLKRASAEKRIDALNISKAAAIYELSQLYDRRIAAEHRDFEFFDNAAKDALARVVEPGKDGRRKLALPHGTVFTTRREHFEWPDDDALVGWAKDHLPEAVRVKETPDRAALKAHVKETGELPDGLSVETVETVQIREA